MPLEHIRAKVSASRPRVVYRWFALAAHHLTPVIISLTVQASEGVPSLVSSSSPTLSYTREGIESSRTGVDALRHGPRCTVVQRQRTCGVAEAYRSTVLRLPSSDRRGGNIFGAPWSDIVRHTDTRFRPGVYDGRALIGIRLLSGCHTGGSHTLLRGMPVEQWTISAHLADHVLPCHEWTFGAADWAGVRRTVPGRSLRTVLLRVQAVSTC